MAEQVLRLGRPRHDLGIEADPVGIQRLPQSAGIECTVDSRQELGGERRLEERTSGAGVAHADTLAHDAETFPRHVLVAADHDHGARAHVLLFADHVRDALLPVVGKRFGRMLEEVRVRFVVSEGAMVGGR